MTVLPSGNSQASTAGMFNIVADGNTICSGATNTPTGYTCSFSTLAQGTHSLSATYVGTYNGGLQANAAQSRSKYCLWFRLLPLTFTIQFRRPWASSSSLTRMGLSFCVVRP